MALLPWKKKEGEFSLPTLQRQMNRLFEDFFGRGFTLEPFGREAWAPSLDVAETDNAVIVKAEVPGVDPKEVDISLSGDVLTIKGEKKEEKEEKGKSYHRIERSYGSFARSVLLPAAIDAEKVEAKYDKGLLEITMPKKPEARVKTIKVNVK
jgi:HSP20 family protein